MEEQRAQPEPASDGPSTGAAADWNLREDWRPEDEWSSAYGDPPPPPRSVFDPAALFVLLDALRRAAPAELQDRLTGLIREALLTLRSLIDWYLERLDRRPAEPRVEDIPID